MHFVIDHIAFSFARRGVRAQKFVLSGEYVEFSTDLVTPDARVLAFGRGADLNPAKLFVAASAADDREALVLHLQLGVGICVCNHDAPLLRRWTLFDPALT
jgi:hypothetical protein